MIEYDDSWKKTPCEIGPRNTRAWFIRTFGLLPKETWVCHKCDQPSCRNITHIFLGTQSDDMKDMVAKGRNVGTKGYKFSKESKLAISLAQRKNPSKAKLTKEQVSEIRNSSLSKWELVAKFNVDWQTIHCIKVGKTWIEEVM